jgi:hypothetical protein
MFALLRHLIGRPPPPDDDGEPAGVDESIFATLDDFSRLSALGPREAVPAAPPPSDEELRQVASDLADQSRLSAIVSRLPGVDLRDPRFDRYLGPTRLKAGPAPPPVDLRLFDSRAFLPFVPAPAKPVPPPEGAPARKRPPAPPEAPPESQPAKADAPPVQETARRRRPAPPITKEPGQAGSPDAGHPADGKRTRAPAEFPRPEPPQAAVPSQRHRGHRRD